jgi:hypothetical protein
MGQKAFEEAFPWYGPNSGQVSPHLYKTATMPITMHLFCRRASSTAWVR